MPRVSAVLLVYRRGARGLEVLLAHPGGPYWARRDAGAWSIPKGEVEADEDPRAAACREFAEELGMPAPAGEMTALSPVKQKGGKTVLAWAIEGDVDVSCLVSQQITIDWPPRSGRRLSFPEIDRLCWVALDEARGKLVQAQVGLVDELELLIGV